MSGSCAAVIGNDWSVLVPDPDAAWTPHAVVSICIPTRDPGPGLARTLKCLAVQTYPADLIEVVIADDGSDIPIAVPDGLPYDVKVVRQERTLDFGAGQARNLAATAATGEILFFLDADVVPERQVVESYARWFDRCDLVVPMGICRFVDVDHLDDQALVALVEAGEMAEHFAGTDVDDQGWRERHFERTHDLRIEAIDAFRVTIGATLAVSADRFHAVGGFPELGVRGVEDTAFGHRVHNDGGILILDRDAMHWHQGRRNVSDPARRERINEVRAPFVESLMPVRGFRRGEPPVAPPVEIVPIARIRTHGDTVATGLTRRSIEAVASRNVAIADDPVAAAYDGAFVQVELPGGVLWSPSTVEQIVALFDAHQVGVVKAVVEGTVGAIVTVARTRALRRAVRVRPDDDPLTVAGELFGAWWVDGASLGLATAGADGSAAHDQDLGGDGDVTPWTSRGYDLVIDVLRRLTR